MDYTIAIPTFNRPKIIREKSLALLNKHNIDKSKIKIFVESEEMKNILFVVCHPDDEIFMAI